jgi:DNA-directed RNA polymerase specialized sigma24 family protein
MTSAECPSLQDPVASLLPDVLSPLCGIAPQDCDSPINDLVTHYEPYIRMQVIRKAPIYRLLVHPDVVDMELDDIAEHVLVGFWQKLCTGTIHYPEAYIQRMIDYAFLDILRRQKRQGVPVPLSLMPEDDPSRESVLEMCDETALDPETDLIQQESASQRARQIARALGQLPPRQKLAMECSLCEHLADIVQFSPTFTAYHVNIENAQWPGTEEEKRRLKASLFAARSTLAHALNIDLSEYKRRGASRLF